VRAFHNSPADSSEKSAENSALSVDSPRAVALKLAADLARQLGMVRTWPNVQAIRLAIETEAEYSQISVGNAAALIVCAALDFTIVSPEHYSFQAATILRKSNNVNRFWFEDCLWRHKDAYKKMLYQLQQRSEVST
jgi:hypothetical protein